MKTKQALRSAGRQGTQCAFGPDVRGAAGAARTARRRPPRCSRSARVPRLRASPFPHATQAGPLGLRVHTSEPPHVPQGATQDPGQLRARGSLAPPCALGAAVPSPRRPDGTAGQTSGLGPPALLRASPPPRQSRPPLGSQERGLAPPRPSIRAGCRRRPPPGLWALLA